MLWHRDPQKEPHSPSECPGEMGLHYSFTHYGLLSFDKSWDVLTFKVSRKQQSLHIQEVLIKKCRQLKSLALISVQKKVLLSTEEPWGMGWKHSKKAFWVVHKQQQWNMWYMFKTHPTSCFSSLIDICVCWQRNSWSQGSMLRKAVFLGLSHEE